MKNKIVSIDAVISRIEINGYIDCTEFNDYMEDYEYDNIIYYLKKYKDLQKRIDKAIEYIEKFSDPSIGIIKTILKESGE